MPGVPDGKIPEEMAIHPQNVIRWFNFIFLSVNNGNIKTFNMYVYKILKLILAYNCRYKLKHCINDKNSLDHILLIIHWNIILRIYTDMF